MPTSAGSSLVRTKRQERRKWGMWWLSFQFTRYSSDARAEWPPWPSCGCLSQAQYRFLLFYMTRVANRFGVDRVRFSLFPTGSRLIIVTICPVRDRYHLRFSLFFDRFAADHVRIIPARDWSGLMSNVSLFTTGSRLVMWSFCPVRDRSVSREKVPITWKALLFFVQYSRITFES